MLAQETFPIFAIAECFRASGAGGAKSACRIAGGQTPGYALALQVGVQESGVEAVTRGDPAILS
jgi:hypothetical protein